MCHLWWWSRLYCDGSRQLWIWKAAVWKDKMRNDSYRLHVYIDGIIYTCSLFFYRCNHPLIIMTGIKSYNWRIKWDQLFWMTAIEARVKVTTTRVESRHHLVATDATHLNGKNTKINIHLKQPDRMSFLIRKWEEWRGSVTRQILPNAVFCCFFLVSFLLFMYSLTSWIVTFSRWNKRRQQIRKEEGKFSLAAA